jgi:hypothetical protein
MKDDIIYFVIIIFIIYFGIKIYKEFRSIKRLEIFTSNFLKNKYSKGNNFSGQIATTPYTSIAENVRLDKFNRVQGLTVSPPLPKRGEIDCIRVICKNHFPSNVKCWKCS